MRLTGRWVVRAAIIVGGAVCYSTANGQPVRMVTSFPESQPLPYLGNGIIGYRIKPNPFMSWKGVASGFVGATKREASRRWRTGPIRSSWTSSWATRRRCETARTA